MWELDCEESWAQKDWCFWTVVLEKTLESPLDCKDIQPVHPKDTVLDVDWKDWCWSWNFNILTTWWEELTHLKRPWCRERLKARGEGWDEDEMVRWHHQLNGHEFGWTPGVGDGQGGLACYGSWDRKESDTTEQLNWTEKISYGNKCRNTCWLRKTENLREMTEVKKWERECIRSLDETVEKHCPLGAGMRGGGGQRAGCLGSGWWYSHECDKGMSD